MHAGHWLTNIQAWGQGSEPPLISLAIWRRRMTLRKELGLKGKAVPKTAEEAGSDEEGSDAEPDTEEVLAPTCPDCTLHYTFRELGWSTLTARPALFGIRVHLA